MSEKEILEKLRNNLLNYDSEGTERTAKEALGRGVLPLEAINVLTDTARELGEKFGRGEIFLTELMMAGDALSAGMNALRDAVPKGEMSKRGTVVIGTVKGDIHDIGKNIVIAMLVASGFDVQDIGKDVSTPTFAEMAEKYRPDIVGISALMSTSTPMQKEIIEYFKAIGIRSKCAIMVGGGAVTREYAEEIGADGYAPDAVEAAKLAANLPEKRTGKW